MLCSIFVITAVISLQGVQSLFYNDSSNDVRHASCRFRSVRQAEYHWNLPEQSMTESFVLDDVEYKLCRYHVTWDEALVFCSSHKSRLATLDSEEKTAFVIQAIASSSSVSEDFWIGARKLYDDPWAWTSNGRRLNSENDIISNIAILYPGFESNDVQCLTIYRSGHDEPIFVPRACNQRRGFICQRDNDRAFDNIIRMVSATRIGDHEFRLYSGRATWAEAVVQCRQEGLQIGEVNTVVEARALAISMLRNRPEGIESAWIGGYTREDDPSTWRWLASGEKIENSNMWRRNLSESSGSCLLLDRHVCESPVYVESTCDRKRDVLCQKPLKKRPTKTPVAVFVNGCPYWIGFHPMKWLDARRSCESLNASLVVLDSPATISHVISIMLDNKADLRHIWTDGRRSKTNGQWQWSVTGESIPEFGKSFIPWCPEDDYRTNENGCMNLDRENLDSPLVYGLSCREKQTYVCQPRSGDCVFHLTPQRFSDALSDASEDVQKLTTFEFPPPLYKDMATLSLSTRTTTNPITNHNYAVVQTTLHSESHHFDDLNTWEPDGSDSVKNSSSRHDFAQYFKPFTRITLPSLPQFGFKVVSATETSTNSHSFETKKKKNKAYKFPTTSSYSSGVTILPPSSSFSTSVKKYPSGARKASKLAVKSGSFSIASNPSDSRESIVSSIPSLSTTEESSKVVNFTRPTFTQILQKSKSSLGSKNQSKSSKTSKITSSTSSTLPDDSASTLSTSDFARTKTYSIKTTRALNSSSVTKMASATTAKASDRQTATSETRIKSATKEFRQNSPPKPVRPNSTLVSRRRQNFRVTTEATTPYDAIDEDYYTDEKDEPLGKKAAEEDAEETVDSGEYSEDYDTKSSGKMQTKKKSKQTSSSSIRKNSAKKVDADDSEEEDEEKEATTKSSIPIAEELSKGLESALVKMMKEGVERRNNENVLSGLRIVGEQKRPSKPLENVAWIKEETYNGTVEKSLKATKRENFSLRPYYAFEGPMVADLPESEGVERTGDDGGREFKFIGKKMSEENFPDGWKIEERNVSNNETRRRMKSEQLNRRIPEGGNLALSMSGMPAIQPNDPNSLMQLGRYFKNKFRGFAENSKPDGVDRRPLMSANAREEVERNGRRRFGSSGRPFVQDRLRGRPANGEEEMRRKGQRWERLRRTGARETEANYYEGGRRLYPRGNYDIYGYVPRQGGRENEGSPREEKTRLDASWPDRKTVNYENFDEIGQAVSPRSSPALVRTTRSFHEEVGARKIEVTERRPFPDFKLSKLVKEVKIDLDQRMLRRYLEGFMKKFAERISGNVDDDWKATWRRLLRELMTILEKMNVNVNGDLMKLKIGGDGRENKLSVTLGNSGEFGRKSGLRKQRKDSANAGGRNNSNSLMKANETSGKSFGSKSRVLQTADNLQAKDLAKVKFEGNSTTKETLEEKKMKDTRLQGLNTNNKKLGGESSINHEERTQRPAMINQTTSTFFQPKYTNFSNLRLLGVRQSFIPVARLSTVFGYRPLMPQLHHRVIFQPGWSQIQGNPGPRKVFSGDYLPKGTLSRIVDSGKKNERFGGKTNEEVKSERKYFGSASSTAKPENHHLEKNRKNSLDEKISGRSGGEEKKIEEIDDFHTGVASLSGISFEEDSGATEQRKFKEDDANYRGNFSGGDNNEVWREVAEEVKKNKLPKEDLPVYYNVTYGEENSDGRIAGDKDETLHEVDAEIVEDGVNTEDDYERKPVWSPAHRLTKALQLSVLRKFGGNPSTSLRSKNLVTRSVKEIEAIDNSRWRKIAQNLENLEDEPSIISLRMIMDPERKSTRISRQSQDSRSVEASPRSIELRVQFSGREESRKAITERIYSRNSLTREEKKNQSLHGSSISDRSLRRNTSNPDSSANRNDKLKSPAKIERPFRFVDKERRRAMLNRLRERSRKMKTNYLRSYATRRVNETAIGDPRDRRSRNIGLGGRNTLGDAKAKEDPEVKHFIATALRKFDDKNLTHRGESKRRNSGKSYGRDLGVDWIEHVSALFADMKESSDDLTLYIDLTLGRVGSKPRSGGRSRG